MVRVPDAVELTSTRTLRSSSEVPASTGIIAVRCSPSRVPPSLSEQLQPVTEGVAANVSPGGNMTPTSGWLWIGPPQAASERPTFRV